MVWMRNLSWEKLGQRSILSLVSFMMGCERGASNLVLLERGWWSVLAKLQILQMFGHKDQGKEYFWVTGKLCVFCFDFSWGGHTLPCTQRSFLGALGWPYGMLGIEPGLASCKAYTLLIHCAMALSPNLVESFNCSW